VTRALASSVGTVVYLAHSQEDKDHVDAARRLLEFFGARIFVDWQDGEMPQTTSFETARKVRDRIVECKRFVLLSSERSTCSHWGPWELGYAEGKKGFQSVAVLPFIQSGTIWKGAPYAGLYATIEMGADGGAFVNKQGTPMPLSGWLE
jgi:hypothetical protein